MLRDLNLKMEYNEDDDILRDFFTPCFSACTTFDRCVDYFALSNMVSMVERFESFASGRIRVRLVVGHKFGIRDVNTLSRMFAGTYRGKGDTGEALEHIMDMILKRQVMFRIAVPAIESSAAVFNERLGVFGDEHGDEVAFRGPLIYSPTAPGVFETIDAFTSWEDPARVEIKRKNFEALWEGRVKSARIYDFIDADQAGMLKYSAEWAINH